MPSEPPAKPTLGRLEKLDPSNYWQDGAADFMLWLTQPENLALVGESVGLSLRVAGSAAVPDEDPAGAMVASLLCQNTVTTDWVLVAAQMDASDTVTLGQLITQGAVLRVTTVIWIASQFLPEHRAALDWLNTLGQGQVQFCGVELELWGIGSAAMAVDFAPVCLPPSGGDHRATASLDPEAAADLPADLPTDLDPEPAPLTADQQQNLDFWSCLGKALDARGSIVKPGAPSTEATTGFAIGRAGFRLYTTLDREAARLTTALHLADEDAHAHFYLLAAQQDRIEADVASPLTWDDQHADHICSIYCALDGVDIEDRDRWPVYLEWLCDRLEAFHHAFSDRIKSLDAAHYEPLPNYSFNPLQGSLSLPG